MKLTWPVGTDAVRSKDLYSLIGGAAQGSRCIAKALPRELCAPRAEGVDGCRLKVRSRQFWVAQRKLLVVLLGVLSLVTDSWRHESARLGVARLLKRSVHGYLSCVDFQVL